LIHSLRADFPITELCEALDVSASGYHAARTRQPSTRQKANLQLLVSMKTIHAHRHTHCYGSPRMTHELRARGLDCSQNRVARLMRAHGLRAQPRKPYRPKTTRPDHAAHPSPNLLAEAPAATAPGTHLVSDITYIPTQEGWLYLAVVLDLFSRCILGWKLSESLHTEVVTGALGRALATGHIAKGAIFHSDRGCQYTATATRSLLAAHHLRQSMSAAAYCYDNAFAESVFASLKSELLPDGQSFTSKPAAALALFDYLETFYNRSRRHSALNFQSPLDFLNHYFQSQKPSLN
jgi:putative transposase